MVYAVERGHCHGGDLLDGQDLLGMMLLQTENFDGARGASLNYNKPKRCLLIFCLWINSIKNFPLFGSIYEKRLQAVPLSPRNQLEQV